MLTGNMLTSWGWSFVFLVRFDDLYIMIIIVINNFIISNHRLYFIFFTLILALGNNISVRYVLVKFICEVYISTFYVHILRDAPDHGHWRRTWNVAFLRTSLFTKLLTILFQYGGLSSTLRQRPFKIIDF